MKLFKLTTNSETEDSKGIICCGEVIAENRYQFIERKCEENTIKIEVLSNQSIKLSRMSKVISFEALMEIGEITSLTFTEPLTKYSGEIPIRTKEIEFDFEKGIHLHYALMSKDTEIEDINMLIIPWSE